MRGAQSHCFGQRVARLLSLYITNSYLFFKVLIFQPAVTEYHELGGLNKRNVLSHSSGSKRSKTRVSAVCAPMRLFCSLFFLGEGEPIPGLPPSFCWAALVFLVSAFTFTRPFPACTCLPIFPFYKSSSLGVHPTPYDFILTHMCNNYLQMRSRSKELGVRTSAHEFWDTSQSITKARQKPHLL